LVCEAFLDLLPFGFCLLLIFIHPIPVEPVIRCSELKIINYGTFSRKILKET
jgi:hypothetical protein